MQVTQVLDDQLPDNLFVSEGMVPRLELLGDKVPVMLVDDVYRDPEKVRAEALKLDFETPDFPYPGRIASIRQSNPSVTTFARNLLRLVNSQYLPRLPSVLTNGKAIPAFSRVLTDFGIVDTLPNDLMPLQRRPHVDPVPVFGLIYLNEEQRGGTMFFDRVRETRPAESLSGYFREGDDDFRLIGKIGGRYNQLVIYPGLVPHSGEIVGDWIETEERLTRPRLTQRFRFFV